MIAIYNVAFTIYHDGFAVHIVYAYFPGMLRINILYTIVRIRRWFILRIIVIA